MFCDVLLRGWEAVWAFGIWGFQGWAYINVFHLLVEVERCIIAF